MTASLSDSQILGYVLDPNHMTDTNTIGYRGETAVFVATFCERAQNSFILLSRGADATIIVRDGRESALHHAARCSLLAKAIHKPSRCSQEMDARSGYLKKMV